MRRAFAAFALSLFACSAPAKSPTTTEPQQPRPVVVAPTSGHPTTAADAPTDPHPLPMFAWAMRIVRGSYVDPPRLVPRALLEAALADIQRQMAELVVELRPDDVVVRVNDKHRVFGLADVKSDDDLVKRLEAIFGFMKAHKNAETDLGKLEYDAMNGALESLDPHSTLLEPEDSKAMTARLSGKFAGLGIVIGIDRDKAKPRSIIVRELIAGDTPANRAKLLVGDRILRINNEPTQNLTTEDASSRLRGDPNTEVVLDIERGDKVTPVRVQRAIITVPAVSGRMAAPKVGYLKLDQFSSDISVEVGRMMDDLRRKGARSWVVDLRGNSGGFLNEAVKIVDRFVEAGTIVTSVGPAKKRDYSAGKSELDDRAPLVVLIDGESASSSEIVAGALKYLDRAVLVGSTSFGKGSVQTLHDHPSGAKLKITTAQYLSAKGISIQSTGIVPDFELDRVVVPDKLATPRDVLRLAIRRGRSEADLEAHLTSASTITDKPSEVLGYLDEKSPGNAPRTRLDFPLDFAVELAGAAPSAKRAQLVGKGVELVAKHRKTESGRLAKALEKLGVDWSSAPAGPAAPAQLVASFTVDKPKVTAGGTFAITGTVTNTGKTTAYQVHAEAKSDDTAFDETEFAFGKIEPGTSKRMTIFLETSKAADSRKSLLAWSFGPHAAQVQTQPTAVEVEGLPRPRFAYSYHVVDDNDGNVQPGEKQRLHVRVKNVGLGKGPATIVTLKSLAADRILVDKGHVDLGAFEPGQTRDVELAYAIRNHLDLSELKLQLTIADTDLLDDVDEEITLRVKTAVGIAPQKGTVALAADTTLRMGADDKGNSLGQAPRGTTFAITGQGGGWTRLELAPGRPAFVLSPAVKPAASPVTAFEPRWQATPPQLVVTEPVRETADASVKVSGFTQDDTKLDDLYILVYNRTAKQRRRKVFYLSNRGGDPTAKIPFSTDVTLQPGSNAITVIARESSKIRSVQTFWVNRR